MPVASGLTHKRAKARWEEMLLFTAQLLPFLAPQEFYIVCSIDFELNLKHTV